MTEIPRTLSVRSVLAHPLQYLSRFGCASYNEARLTNLFLTDRAPLYFTGHIACPQMLDPRRYLPLAQRDCHHHLSTLERWRKLRWVTLFLGNRLGFRLGPCTRIEIVQAPLTKPCPTTWLSLVQRSTPRQPKLDIPKDPSQVSTEAFHGLPSEFSISGSQVYTTAKFRRFRMSPRLPIGRGLPSLDLSLQPLVGVSGLLNNLF